MAVRLDRIVDELETLFDDAEAYLNPHTGEVVTLTSQDISLVEDDEDPEELMEWERDRRLKAREVLKSDDYLPLPTKFEIHEHDTMRRFCLTIRNDLLRGDLLDAIHGQGAFGRFKSIIRRRNIEDAWFKYRKEAIEEIAIDWLTENEIAYTRASKAT